MKNASRIQVTSAQWREIVAHIQSELPNEACGLLGGAAGRAEKVYPVASLAPSPVAFQMEPKAQIRAMLEIEAAGWDVTGIYHSHPGGPAVPSATDVENAFYPESVYLIVSPDGLGGWQARGFWIVDGRVSEVPVVIAGHM